MITSPTRKIPLRYNGVSGLFPSKKNGGKMVPYGSLLERNYMLLEFDNTVDRYVGQPVTIPDWLSNENKLCKSGDTPDFIVYFLPDADGVIPPPTLIEIMEKKNWRKIKRRIDSPSKRSWSWPSGSGS